MKETRSSIMGLPITVNIADPAATPGTLAQVFDYFIYVDKTFSTYKDMSEISCINRGEVREDVYSKDMREVLQLSEDTKRATDGYFDIRTPEGHLDPSGLVKGWAIRNAGAILSRHGFENFYIEAGGDIAAIGLNEQKEPWRVGIRDPFSDTHVVKVVSLSNRGIATSGNYIRGEHIYDPHVGHEPKEDIVSLSVIARDVYEADRFATAAFAMGRAGIHFIERLDGCEGYMIDSAGIATMTTGFEKFVIV